MREQTRPQAVSTTSQRSREATDVDVKRILVIAAVVAALLALFSLCVWYFQAALAPSQPAIGILPGPPPPYPQLQPQAYAGVEQYRTRAENRLQSYGWVDRQQGIVHIPIARAMDIISARPTEPRR